MSSLPIEGTISAKPFTNLTGTISAPVNRITGSISGKSTGSISGEPAGSISGETADSAENSAIAELNTLINSLGTLSAQAQGMPLSPPTLPGLPQGGYQPQATDYLQFAQDAD
jgi:hypothetical protein